MINPNGSVKHPGIKSVQDLHLQSHTNDAVRQSNGYKE